MRNSGGTLRWVGRRGEVRGRRICRKAAVFKAEVVYVECHWFEKHKFLNRVLDKLNKEEGCRFLKINRTRKQGESLQRSLAVEAEGLRRLLMGRRVSTKRGVISESGV
ncbi:hypothetical protein L917_17443 [Phytophthora nicotianae]|uniref:Uncharacterized protein n=1 Tax=Phytophthora nicotianae TaxID=4792 RepID=W2KCR8_PHYNI|nr:hypothetical protein L917_17443 [Phytophthora nicotianae]